MSEVSIRKGNNAGAPVAKDKEVIFIPYNAVDLAQFPTRDARGVLIAGNIVLVANAAAIGIEVTQKQIDRKDTPEGEDDAMGVIQEVSVEHPGDSLEINEFLQNNLDAEGFVITRGCSNSSATRLHGTPCNPVKVSYEEGDNNDGRKKSIKFTSVQRGQYKSAHYTGDLPTLEDYNDGSAGGGV